MIGLAKAFELVCEHRISDWHKIISETEAISAELESKNIRYLKGSRAEAIESLAAATDDDFSPDQKEVMRIGAQQRDLVLRVNWRKADADRIMREALASGAITAKIYNPRTDQPADVPDIGRWLPPSGSRYEPGFRNDYVEKWDIKKPMPDQPGPPTNFDDQTLYRVFFDETAFNEWLGGEDAQAQTFTPYPPLDEATMAMPKVKVAREMLELRWPEGSPDKLSVQKMAELTTKKFNSRGRVVLNGRGNRITVITEDDIKRALGRK
jgi:hypothetical protein